MKKKKVLGQPRHKTSKINGLGSHLKVMVLAQYYLDVHQEQKTKQKHDSKMNYQLSRQKHVEQELTFTPKNR